MIVAHEEREVGVAAVQHEGHRRGVVGLDLDDGIDDRLGRRLRVLAAVLVDRGDDVGCLDGLAVVELGVLAAVLVDRGDDVVGLDGLAVVELGALLDLEGPGDRIVRGLPALRQARHQLAGVVDLGQIVLDGIAHLQHEAVFPAHRIEGIGGLAVGLADPQVATLVGCRQDLVGEAAGCSCAEAEGKRPLHEAAAANLAVAQLPLECLQVIHYGPPMLNLFCLGTGCPPCRCERVRRARHGSRGSRPALTPSFAFGAISASPRLRGHQKRHIRRVIRSSNGQH